MQTDQMEQAAQERERPAFQMPKAKKKRRWLFILIGVLIAAGLLYFFIIRPMMGASQQTASFYREDKAAIRDLTVSINGAATVRAADSYQVSSLVKGEVLSANFDEGGIVQKDDVLYEIDMSDMESTIARSELSYQRTQNSYQDILKNIETAKKDLQNAAKDLVLTAEDGGVITKLHVEVGDTVNVGTPIVTIFDRDNVMLKVPFHAAAAQDIRAGDYATVTLTASGELLGGTVTEVDYVDTAGVGGTLLRTVTIQVKNPGGITEQMSATAAVGNAASAASGTFTYKTSTTLTAKKGGEIEAIHVTEGGSVADGGKVMTLSREKATESYQKQLDNLQNNLRDATTSIEDARLSLENTRKQLDNYTIKSPITGTVIVKYTKEGDNVEGTATGAMAIIYDLSYLTFELRIDELDIGRVEVGQTVYITADALSGQRFVGYVDKININGTTSGGVTTYPVTVVIEQAGDLLPGMNVSADIMVEEAAGVLAIPVSAVQRGNTVFVPKPEAYGADGTIDLMNLTEDMLDRVEVTLGRNDDNYIEILSGLKEGDTIIVRTQINASGFNMMNMGGMSSGPMVVTSGQTFTAVPGGGSNTMVIRGAP